MGIGVAERSDERAPVAHHRVGDERGGRSHRRLRVLQQAGVFEIPVAAKGPHMERPAGIDVVKGEAGEVVDVDEQLGATRTAAS